CQGWSVKQEPDMGGIISAAAERHGLIFYVALINVQEHIQNMFRFSLNALFTPGLHRPHEQQYDFALAQATEVLHHQGRVQLAQGAALDVAGKEALNPIPNLIVQHLHKALADIAVPANRDHNAQELGGLLGVQIAQHGEQETLQFLAYMAFAVQLGQYLFSKLLGACQQNSQQEVFFGREVIVKSALGAACQGSDLGHGRGLKTIFAKNLGSNFQNFVAAFAPLSSRALGFSGNIVVHNGRQKLSEQDKVSIIPYQWLLCCCPISIVKGRQDQTP